MMYPDSFLRVGQKMNTVTKLKANAIKQGEEYWDVNNFS